MRSNGVRRGIRREYPRIKQDGRKCYSKVNPTFSGIWYDAFPKLQCISKIFSNIFSLDFVDFFFYKESFGVTSAGEMWTLFISGDGAEVDICRRRQLSMAFQTEIVVYGEFISWSLLQSFDWQRYSLLTFLGVLSPWKCWSKWVSSYLKFHWSIPHEIT